MSRSKNLTNYHSHSLYCDGRASMEDFVRFALSEGFTSYGFSSHAPLPFSTAWTMAVSYTHLYTQYRDWKDVKAAQEKEKEKEAAKTQEEKTAKVRLNEKRRMSFKEKREFEQLEQEIAALEAEKQSIEEALCSGAPVSYTHLSKRVRYANAW